MAVELGFFQVLHWRCLIAVREALPVPDLTEASACRPAFTPVPLDKRSLWLRTNVCVGIVAS
jgi:hypothetical protein